MKAAARPHAEVGDRANDAVRVDAEELRCRVVGEGGNLGFTQRARIEYARGGGRINTDAIDNSAGVDCSDHEVNIKILLDTVVADGDLTGKQRNAMLAEMTDEVAALVLRDNYEQTQAIACSLAQAAVDGSTCTRATSGSLEQAGLLNRELEFLPTDEGFGERQAAGRRAHRTRVRALLSPYRRSPSRRSCSPPTCRRTRTCPASSSATSRRACARSSGAAPAPPAAAGDHRVAGRQRPRQPRRDDLRLPSRGRDRRRRRRHRARLHRGPRGVRPARALGRDRGARRARARGRRRSRCCSGRASCSSARRGGFCATAAGRSTSRRRSPATRPARRRSPRRCRRCSVRPSSRRRARRPRRSPTSASRPSSRSASRTPEALVPTLDLVEIAAAAELRRRGGGGGLLRPRRAARAALAARPDRRPAAGDALGGDGARRAPRRRLLRAGGLDRRGPAARAPAPTAGWPRTRAPTERSLQVLADIRAGGTLDLARLSVAVREMRNLVHSSGAPAPGRAARCPAVTQG